MRRPCAYRVRRLGRSDVEPRERRARARRVVDRQNEAPLDLRQLVGELVEVGTAEHVLAVIGLAAPIGRIEVEQHAGAVIAADEVGVAELLDHDAGQSSRPGRRPRGGDRRRRHHGHARSGRVGALDATQFLGRENDKISLSGAAYAELMAGRASLDQLRDMAAVHRYGLPLCTRRTTTVRSRFHRCGSATHDRRPPANQGRLSWNLGDLELN